MTDTEDPRRLTITVTISDEQGDIVTHTTELTRKRTRSAELIGGALGDAVNACLGALFIEDANCALEDAVSCARRALPEPTPKPPPPRPDDATLRSLVTKESTD